MKTLNRTAILRMVGTNEGIGNAGGGTGGSGGSGGQMPDLSGYATTDWVRILTWWGQSLPQNGTDIVGALTGVTDITMTGVITGATGLTMNSGAISGVTTLAASGRATVESLRIGDGVLKWDSQNNAFYVEKADGSVASFYTRGSVSALGFSASGGGGGGATDLADLDDVALSTPQTGQVLMYNGTTGKWYNGTVQGGGGGTVTSITAGTGLTGGTITASGTIALSQETQTAIAAGVTAYGWGDHAQAGYLTSSDISDMATKTWVNNQGFLTSSAISDMATKTWVNNQGFLTSSAISDMATKTWVGQQGFLTSEQYTGTVTSIAMSVPTGFSISGTPITSSGTLALTFASGYSLPTTAKQTNWDTAYGWGDHAQAGYLTSSSNIAFSQLPTMYWANVAISNQSNTNTTPQFGSVRIRPDSAYYGGYLRFGDGDYAFIAEQVDDKLTYKAGWHNFVTGQVNAAVGLRLGGAVSGTSLSGGCLIEWDSQNNAIKVNGNIYATGFVSALGAGSGVGAAELQTLTLTGDGTGKGLYITDGDIELESGIVYAESGFRTSESYGFGTSANAASLYFQNGHLYFWNGSTTITLA